MLDGIGNAEVNEGIARAKGFGSVYDVTDGYRQTPKPLTSMTYDEVQALQDDRGGPVGRYEFEPGTLQEFRDRYGLTGQEPFDSNLQDQIALDQMQHRGWGAPNHTSAQLQENLGHIWSTIARPTTDQSRYWINRTLPDGRVVRKRQLSPIKTKDFQALYAQSQAAARGGR